MIKLSTLDAVNGLTFDENLRLIPFLDWNPLTHTH
jgi:hypothetical protein